MYDRYPAPSPLPFVLMGPLMILAFCGGPLYVTDMLEPVLGDPWHFAVGFAPIAVLMYATLTLEDRPSRWTKFMGWLGGAGSALLLASTGAAIDSLDQSSDPKLTVAGAICALIVCAWYARQSNRHFAWAARLERQNLTR